MKIRYLKKKGVGLQKKSWFKRNIYPSLRWFSRDKNHITVSKFTHDRTRPTRPSGQVVKPKGVLTTSYVHNITSSAATQSSHRDDDGKKRAKRHNMEEEKLGSRKHIHTPIICIDGLLSSKRPCKHYRWITWHTSCCDADGRLEKIPQQTTAILATRPSRDHR